MKMAKTSMFCPFNKKLCRECSLYRGRHYYLSLCQRYGGFIANLKGDTKPITNHRPVDFQTLWKLVQPWAAADPQPETKTRIKLRLIDVEKGTSRVCQLNDAKAWDWGDTQTMRVIGDLQVTSWDKLFEIARFKAKKGYKEIDIYEAPRFMLLGGG